MLNHITAIVFDLDGTLIDSSRDIWRSINLALKELGLPGVDLEQVKREIGPGPSAFIRSILSDGRLDVADKLLEVYEGVYSRNCTQETKLYPGVKEVLEYLTPYKLALTTNKPRFIADKILNHFDLAGRFRVVLGPEDVVKLKPDPEMILKALDSLDEPPEKAMVIGDTPFDIIAGKRAGTITCGVTYGYCPPGLLEEKKPDFLIDRLDELMRLL